MIPIPQATVENKLLPPHSYFSLTVFAKLARNADMDTVSPFSPLHSAFLLVDLIGSPNPPLERGVSAKSSHHIDLFPFVKRWE